MDETPIQEQLPKPASPGLRQAILAGDITRFVPIAGTHGWRDAWWKDEDSPFACMMKLEGYTPIRARDSRPFRWSTDLNGLKFWSRNSDWEAGADALYYFLENVPFRDRNIIAHSHGGQVAQICAASGLLIRSLTTVGTPNRDDVDSFAAARNIGFWQHIYDRKRDWIALLGQMGDRELDRDRSFKNVPGVLNHPIDGISHSGVLRDERFLGYWTVNGWLNNIKGSSIMPPTKAA